MLPEDTALVARDPELSGLAWLLDPERLREVAVPWWGAAERVRVRYFQYKPGANATAVVSVIGGAGEIWWTVRAYAAWDREKFRHRAAHAARFGGGSVAELALTVEPLSADAAMPELAGILADPLGRLMDLSPTVAAAGDALRLVPLRFKPGRRFVGRLEAGGRAFGVVRVYPSDRFEGAYEGWKRLSAAGVLGRSRSRGVMVVPWVPGVASAAVGWDPVVLHEVGRVLAQLHATSVPRAWRARMRPSVIGVRRGAEALAQVLPGEAPRIARLLASVVEGVERGQPRACVHGDLHGGQVIAAEGRVSLIDFDEAGVGAPGWDLATFAVDAFLRGAREGDLAGLWEGYGGRPADLSVHVGTAYLLRAGRAFRERGRGWASEARACLAAAERAVEGLG